RVEIAKLTARVSASGTLSALVTVQVGTQVSGRIMEIGADFNTEVKRGQVIARIDPELFEAAVEHAKASEIAAAGRLQRARFQAGYARRQHHRVDAVRAAKLISEADFETSKTNSRAADADVMALTGSLKQASAELHQAQINLDHTKVISPISGIVISRNVDV